MLRVNLMIGDREVAAADGQRSSGSTRSPAWWRARLRRQPSRTRSRPPKRRRTLSSPGRRWARASAAPCFSPPPT